MHFSDQQIPLRILRLWLQNEQKIHVRWNIGKHQADDFAQTPLRTIAVNGSFKNFRGNDKGDFSCGSFFRLNDTQSRVWTKHRTPPQRERGEILFLGQTLRSRKHGIWRGRAGGSPLLLTTYYSLPLYALFLYCDPMTTLQTSALQDFGAFARLHSGSKSVNLGAATLFWLICTLRHVCVASYLCSEDYQIPFVLAISMACSCFEQTEYGGFTRDLITPYPQFDFSTPD